MPTIPNNAAASRHLPAILLLGFASGLPLSLTGSTLQAWYQLSGVDIVLIGYLGLVEMPYVYKFLWAPWMDRFSPPFLGRRQAWMMICQCALLLGLLGMATLSPAEGPGMLGLLALLVAFCSASQDVAIDAYRTDSLLPKERGLGAAYAVFGYRLGMLVAGAFALILADHIGWQPTYQVMALLVGVGLLTSLLAPQPRFTPAPPPTIKAALILPFQEFLSRPKATSLLLLVVLYKLGDAFAGTLSVVFLLDIGFSPTQVGVVNQGMGLLASLLGVLLGGLLLARIGLFFSLIGFGLLQMLSNLSFMWLAYAGPHFPLLIGAVGIENISGGMGTAAFVALLMGLCNHRYSATQFALLSALAALGRVFLPPAAGHLVAALGWQMFFFITTFAALPGLLLLRRLRGEVEQLSGRDEVKSA